MTEMESGKRSDIGTTRLAQTLLQVLNIIVIIATGDLIDVHPQRERILLTYEKFLEIIHELHTENTGGFEEWMKKM